jgi:hypothetical protein
VQAHGNIGQRPVLYLEVGGHKLVHEREPGFSAVRSAVYVRTSSTFASDNR